jgi:hypothetical protein
MKLVVSEIDPRAAIECVSEIAKVSASSAASQTRTPELTFVNFKMIRIADGVTETFRITSATSFKLARRWTWTRLIKSSGISPAAPHESCNSNTLRLEHSSPNRPADLLAEDDVTTLQIDRERTTKQVQFIVCVCLMIDLF